ncbi:MAG: hypothetical protein ACI8QF_002744 [Limisphaerales bacterium]|jgi:hypothetical protein
MAFEATRIFQLGKRIPEGLRSRFGFGTCDGRELNENPIAVNAAAGDPAELKIGMEMDTTSAEQENAENPGDGSPRVAILYKRDAQPDEQALLLLEGALKEKGYSVFIDRHLEIGVEWAREIEREIRDADAVIPLLSAQSIHSEMMAFEVEHAHDTASGGNGRPHLLPVRVDYTGPLPEPLAGILDPLQYFLWEGEFSNEGLVSELVYALQNLPPVDRTPTELPAKGARLTSKLAARINRMKVEAAPEPEPEPELVAVVSTVPSALESVGGAVPLDSQFYLRRGVDDDLETSIAQRDSIVLIKGARQMGKTSLLARGLANARKQGSRAAFVDLQKLNAVNLESANNFYLTLCETLADQLDLDTLPSDVWDERRSPNVNFERFLRREVLNKIGAPLVWGLDEVDRLFGCEFGSEVFGLFRSWHNERALDPTGPWANLSLVIVYATEAHLFITDMNQSPFNVGTRLEVEDFTQLHVAEMNRRYRGPLKNSDETNRLVRLVGGHPYLVRRALHELATDHKLDIENFETYADQDEWIFGDHLRRMLVLLARDLELTEVVRGVLRGEPCPTPESFYRLRAAGVMNGSTQNDVRPRCRLYAQYLRRHLL